MRQKMQRISRWLVIHTTILLILLVPASMISQTYLDEIPWNMRVSLGVVPGPSANNISGYNSDVDTGSLPEDVTTQGGTYQFPTSAVLVQVVSDNAADNAAGTGARTVLVTALDVNFNQFTQLVTMNGLTPVVLPRPVYRVNSFLTQTVGPSGSNVGVITLSVIGSGNILSRICNYEGVVGSGRAQQAVYTVPKDSLLVIQFVQVSLENSANPDGAVTVSLRQCGTSAQSWITISQWILSSSGSSFATTLPPVVTPLQPGTDLKVTVTKATRSNNTVSFTMLSTLMNRNQSTQ